MNKIFIILIVFILCQSCQDKKKDLSFVLNGTIKGNSPEYIFLEYGTIKDSSIVHNNKFHFKGTVENPIEASIVIPPISSMIDDWFYLENSELKLNLNIEKKKIKDFEVNFIKIDTIIGSKTVIIEQDFNEFEKLNRNNKDWNNLLFNKLDEIIRVNSKSSYSGHILVKYCKDSVLSTFQKKQLFKNIDTLSLSKPIKESIVRLIYPEKSMHVGNQMYDFTLPNESGKSVNTSSYRDKILLIDFWASWCIPCRKLNPELLKIYKEYNDNNFEILGVSLDRNLEKWKRAIQNDGLIWKNLIDQDEFNGIVASKYNINSIPSNFLIDKKGNILAVDISIENLKKFLAQNL